MARRPSDELPFVDSTAALASLYQSPLADFIARRSALVSQLKRSGHKDVAARITAAGKPSRAAYLVNQVYWRFRHIYDAVLDAGTAARAAQQARLLGDAGSDLAATLRTRDEAVRAAVQCAERIGADEGTRPSESIVAQVRETFDALAAHGLEARLPHGHLTGDVTLPGLGALAGLVLPDVAEPGPVRRFEVVARRAEPGVTDEAPVALPDPRLVEAIAKVDALTERRTAAAERLDEMGQTADAAAQVASDAERAAEEAAREAAAARSAADRAAASRLAAEKELTRIDSELTTAQARVSEIEGERPPPAAAPGPRPAPDRKGPRRPRR
jgi:hypothetical protein